MIYLSGCIKKYRHHRLGYILTPGRGDAVPADCWIAADNDCFNNPDGYTQERYERFLARLPQERTLQSDNVRLALRHQDDSDRAVRKGRPHKGQPPYHLAFGKQRMHDGWWRDCPICKSAYGRFWRQKFMGSPTRDSDKRRSSQSITNAIETSLPTR